MKIESRSTVNVAKLNLPTVLSIIFKCKAQLQLILSKARSEQSHLSKQIAYQPQPSSQWQVFPMQKKGES